MNIQPSALVYRVAFTSGQYVPVFGQNTPFDAVARAITGGRCVLRSVDVLFVESAADSDSLQDFSAFRQRIAQAIEARAQRKGLH